MGNVFKLINDKAQHIAECKKHYKREQNTCPPSPMSECLEIYFDKLTAEEFNSRNAKDAYGFALWWTNFIQDFNSDECKIKVFNPDMVNGWQTEHTLIAVLQKDMPFLLDSIRLELNRRDFNIHTINSRVFNTERTDGKLQLISEHPVEVFVDKDNTCPRESIIYLEIDRISDPAELLNIHGAISDILAEVRAVNEDRSETIAAIDKLVAEHKEIPASISEACNLTEASGFLEWLCDSNFTFLGYTEDVLTNDADQARWVEDPKKRLGLLKGSDYEQSAVDKKLTNIPVIHRKSVIRSRVHRSVYPEYVIVRRYGASGVVVGQSRILGLYNNAANRQSPSKIPLIRQKISAIINNFDVDLKCHDGRLLLQTIDNFPREEIFQSSIEHLTETIVGIAEINERRQTRLFLREDPDGEFISCLVYTPRDTYSTKIRKATQKLLAKCFNAVEHEFTTHFSDSVLTRTHFVFKIPSSVSLDYDIALLERKISEITRTWESQLGLLLNQRTATNADNSLQLRYGNAFPASYRDHFTPQSAFKDIGEIQSLKDERFCLSIFQAGNEPGKPLHLKLFNLENPIDLSDVIPILEDFGFHVKGEHPYKIEDNTGKLIWLHDFTLVYKRDSQLDLPIIRQSFVEAFSAIWLDRAESDSFNKLVACAQLDWREVVLLRAYARYLKQARIPFSLNYIAETLSDNPEITRQLILLFRTQFHLAGDSATGNRSTASAQLKAEILEKIDTISNLDEDRIMRHYLTMIDATLRTNFYQMDGQEKPKSYISMKFSPRDMSFLPAPRTLYEIFVYSNRFEGVHLRGGKISRGGLRWSDRPQDYRTEVLGLLKAQQVKNSVIVPTGAKGVFVTKKLEKHFNRSDTQGEGIACYKLFIRGLLDITDNIVLGKVSPPSQVVCRDQDDPYLVVAADKGTASFSDIANEIATERGFWLGDAFASGGSHGYDHKAMGITARGAWVAVQRHFRELGIDIQKERFSAIGIGDMSGDVFGNGMLLSPHIEMIAAFNHQHIFIDPEPNPELGFSERKRLFETPYTTWDDYNRDLISKGGGIFSRSAKHIYISEKMKSRFNITESHLTPNDLINRLLKASVDLIWNGGIGTYAKASNETNADADDKINDNLRVNGRDLRCRVFGEGGNLGLTQKGRIEFCLNGGLCNTDFIDNAAGVDCSDHEVNIKILLDSVVASGELTEKQRNELLAGMTQDVSALVLHNNYRQTQAISLAENRPLDRLNEYLSFINDLESEGRLDRKLEGLPEDAALLDRGPNGQSLTRAELSILISYAKEKYQQELLKTDVPEDPYLVQIVETAFPVRLRKDYNQEIYKHRLKREIISTKISNEIIDNMGVIFFRRIMLSSGAALSQVTRAYTVAREILRLEDFWLAMENLDFLIPANLQFEMMHKIIIRAQQTVQWILYNREGTIDPSQEVGNFSEHIGGINQYIAGLTQGKFNDGAQSYKEELIRQNVPSLIADQVSSPTNPCISLGIMEAANHSNVTAEAMAELYIALGERTGLIWLILEASDIRAANHWQSMACCTFIGEIERQLRHLAVTAMGFKSSNDSIETIVDRLFAPQQSKLDAWLAILSELQSAPTIEFALFGILTGQLSDIVKTVEQSSIAYQREDVPQIA